MPVRRKPSAEGKIEKPEDKMWKDWFNGIKENEHDKYLQQLGLDDADLKEWHSMHGKLDKLGDEFIAEAENKGKKRKK